MRVGGAFLFHVALLVANVAALFAFSMLINAFAAGCCFIGAIYSLERR